MTKRIPIFKPICSFFLLANTLFLSCNTPSAQEVKVREHSEASTSKHFHLPKIPAVMEFAGEKINLNDLDIRERLDKELHAIVFFHNLIIPNFKRANRYFPEITRLLRENNVPDDFKYLAVIESGLENIESRSGAHGFWQFMPRTAAEYGLKIDDYIDERLDLLKSTAAAANYLQGAKDTLGSWIEAAASYNRGVAGVRRDQKWQHVDSYFDAHMNNETGRYVFRMLAMKLIFENPEDYGFYLNEMELYPVILTKTVQVKTEIKDIAKWAKEQGFNYKILLKLNPWIKGNSLKYKSTGYSILLPSNPNQLSNYENE